MNEWRRTVRDWHGARSFVRSFQLRKGKTPGFMLALKEAALHCKYEIFQTQFSPT